MWRLSIAKWLAAAVLVASTPPLLAESPGDAVTLALQNARQEAGAAKLYRYLSLVHIPPAERRMVWEVISFHVHSLGHEQDIVPPVVVLAGGGLRECLDRGKLAQYPLIGEKEWQQIGLIRLNISDYGWKPSTYEGLAQQSVFFHRALRYWPGGVDPGDRKHYPAGYYKEKLGAADWLPSKEIAELIYLTGSQAPLLAADNFFWQTCIQTDRAVGYYGLLEVKNEADFNRLVGIDPKVVNKFNRELLAAIANSGVTRKPRRIQRLDKAGGAYYRSLDIFKVEGKKNPLTIYDGTLEFDATEIFAHLLNGFWATGLFDAKGNRQDAAPPQIGYHHQTRDNNGEITIYLACHSCHSQAGLQMIDSKSEWVKNLFAKPNEFSDKDYETIKFLRQRYFEGMEESIERDREIFRRAVFRATGCKAEDMPAKLKAIYYDYDGPMDVERFSRWLGCTPDVLVMSVKARVATKIPLYADEQPLLMFLRKKEDQIPLPIDVAHQVYPLAQDVLAGKITIQK